ncbi:MAG TPA: ABC transporter permease [Chitinophagaceae bacterium]|nr:ABC transporter permease [Chitinophagaceae bacterium]
MVSFLQSYSTEVIKVKNSFAFWLTILCAVIVPIGLLLAFSYEWRLLIPHSGVSPWDDYFTRAFNGCAFTAPLFVLLINGLVLNIEHTSQGWKHIFTLPISRGKTFLSKLLLVLTIIVGFYVLYFSLILITGYFLGTYRSELRFSDYSPEWKYFFAFVIKSFISVLGVTAIQFWLSFRIKNLIVSLGIGLLCFMIAISLTMPRIVWDNVIYYPYAASLLMINHYEKTSSNFFETYHIASIVWFIFFSLFAYWDFTTKFER